MDNGSADDSVEVARRAGAEVTIEAGVPVAAARNRGVAFEGAGDVVAFVDADHELLPGWMRALHEAMARPGVDGAAAAYLGPEQPTPVQRWYAALRGTTREGRIEWAGAGNLALTRAAFERLAGFDERLEACEDVDLCFRLRQAGGVLWGAPGMRSVHHGDPATLGHLFRGELWRGRGNIRVSLRGPWSARSLASMLLPVAQLLVVPAALAAGWLGAPRSGGAVALGVIVVPTVLRTIVLLRREMPRNLSDAAWALAVCATYDAARALALVWRAAHHSVARQQVAPSPQRTGR